MVVVVVAAAAALNQTPLTLNSFSISWCTVFFLNR